MAVCTYTRKDSPFFWLQYGPVNHRTNESSRIRIDDKDADYKIAKKINKIEARLLVRHSISGWDWVPAFFQARYTNPDTLRIERNGWNYIAAYFREAGIKNPESLTRPQVFEYLDWRTSQKKQKSGRSPKRNTALYEMRMLGRVMDEAVLREMCEKNPAANLKLRRDVPPPTPEILADQQGTILDALRQKPQWMQRSFQVALQTGLRRAETIIDLRRQVDWERKRVTIPDPKGGYERAFTFEVMQMSILTFLRGLGRDQWTWQLSEIGPTPWGVVWRRFFDDLGMPEIHFHSTRVTFITWCHRNELPETIVMQLVNHASTEIHRIYQRLNAADVRQWRDRVSDPHLARIAH